MSRKQGAAEARKRGPGARWGSDLVGGHRSTAALCGRGPVASPSIDGVPAPRRRALPLAGMRPAAIAAGRRQRLGPNGNDGTEAAA